MGLLVPQLLSKGGTSCYCKGLSQERKLLRCSAEIPIHAAPWGKAQPEAWRAPDPGRVQPHGDGRAISPWGCWEPSAPSGVGGWLYSDDDDWSGRKPARAQARGLSMGNGRPESWVPLPDHEDFLRHSLCKE